LAEIGEQQTDDEGVDQQVVEKTADGHSNLRGDKQSPKSGWTHSERRMERQSIRVAGGPGCDEGCDWAEGRILRVSIAAACGELQKAE